MPFMPQPQRRPSSLRIVQEILMMKMQAGQQAQQMEKQHEVRMKELDRAYKHDKLLAEEKWEREAPLRQLKFDVEVRKAREDQYKQAAKAKDRRFQLYKDEQDILYKQQQAQLKAITDKMAAQKVLSTIKLEREKYRTQQAKAGQEPSFTDITRERIGTGVAGEEEYQNAIRAGIVPRPPQGQEQTQQDWGPIKHSLEQELAQGRKEKWYGPLPFGGEQGKKGITTSDKDMASLMIEILMNKSIPSAIRTQQVEAIKENYWEKESFYSDPNSPKRPLFFKSPYKMPNVTAPKKPSLGDI